MFPKVFAEEPSLPMPKKIELDEPNVENSNTNFGYPEIILLKP